MYIITTASVKSVLNPRKMVRFPEKFLGDYLRSSWDLQNLKTRREEKTGMESQLDLKPDLANFRVFQNSPSNIAKSD